MHGQAACACGLLEAVTSARSFGSLNAAPRNDKARPSRHGRHVHRNLPWSVSTTTDPSVSSAITKHCAIHRAKTVTPRAGLGVMQARLTADAEIRNSLIGCACAGGLALCCEGRGAAARPRGAHHCYLELHIEQGGTLERENIPVGVVEGIVAIDRYEVTVTGFANHAGTTAMADRQDALLAASHVTIAVRDIVSSEPGEQVGTVGRLEGIPNAPNVIPGVVRLTIELRDLSTEKLKRLAELIRLRASKIGEQTKTSIEFTSSNTDISASAAVEVQQAIERVAGQLGLGTRRLPSGAGHDAKMMAQLSPMGMIFVPSVRGISHSPRETHALGSLRTRGRHHARHRA